MEIFLLPPFGLGGKFGFSLCAQTRTEKLLRGGKIGKCLAQNSRVSAKSDAFSEYSPKSLGQAFLKACWCREGKALRLQSLPL